VDAGIRDRAETGDAERSFSLSAEEREEEHQSSFLRFRGTCCNDCDYRDNQGGTRRSSSTFAGTNDERLAVTLARANSLSQKRSRGHYRLESAIILIGRLDSRPRQRRQLVLSAMTIQITQSIR